MAIEEIQTPEQTIEAFLSSLKEGNVSEAYEGLFAGSPIREAKAQAFEALKKQTSTQLSLYGRVLGHELISKREFGESVVRFVYLLKTEKLPTVWIFHFYRPDLSWYLANVNFGDQLQVLDSFE